MKQILPECGISQILPECGISQILPECVMKQLLPDCMIGLSISDNTNLCSCRAVYRGQLCTTKTQRGMFPGGEESMPGVLLQMFLKLSVIGKIFT